MKIKIPGIKTQSESVRISNDQAAGERYTDIEITTVDKYISGDIVISKAQEAISNSVRNILLTSFGELVYDPGAGANLTSLLFDNNADDNDIKSMVQNALELAEPRVEVLNVEVKRDNDHTLIITVTVNVLGDDTLQNIELEHRIKNLKN